MKYPNLLIIDLDGTVRVNLAADFNNPKTFGFINNPQDQKIIPAAANAIAKYKSQGWAIVGATNQGGVAAGHKTLDECIQEQKYTLQLLGDAVDEDRIVGKCRKPNGGMLVLATQRRRSEVVHFVGDRNEDQLAAINAGLPKENFFWAKDWWQA